MDTKDLSFEKPLLGIKRHWTFSAKLGLSYLQGAWNEKELQGLFATLKGPLMKVAQMTATIPDLLPLSTVETLQNLHHQGPAMTWGLVKRRLESQWGKSWADDFLSFDPLPVFVASLGQVHRATLKKDPTRPTHFLEVACKVQYPRMAQVIREDLRYIGMFCKLYQWYGAGIHTALLQEEMEERLVEETDYLKEAHHLKLFHAIFHQDPFYRSTQNIPTICCPLPVPFLTTPEVLVTHWHEGLPFSDLFQASPQQRNLWGMRLFHGFLGPFFRHGFLHGDPHPGNYTWTKEGVLNLLDFGCVRRFNPMFVQSVVDLYKGFAASSVQQMAWAYEGLGFSGLNGDLVDILHQWTAFVFGPFIRSGTHQIACDGTQAQAVFKHVHQALVDKGGILLPKEFLILNRVLVGIGSLLIRLQSCHPWARLLEELLVPLETLQNNQQRLKIMA